MSKVDHPVMLIVLDGWGHSDATAHNAIRQARTPTWDRLYHDFPHHLISCSGRSVGLPQGQMGNSEVGHMHLGAGRTIDQDYTRISRAIENGDFFQNPVLHAAFDRVKRSGKAVHILGLVSPGGVHSHEAHLATILEFAARASIERVYVHAFLDGRDTPPKSAAASLAFVENECKRLGVGRIATIVGRYYAMDRNNNWERTRAAYELIVDGRAEFAGADPQTALAQAYSRGESDEFVSPTIVAANSASAARVEDGDVLIFANFRADRARQLTSAFVDSDFAGFARIRMPAIDSFITMTSYGAQFDNAAVFPPSELKNTFGNWVSQQGLRQLRIAETEKYAHVTFFFNGGKETPDQGEDRILIPSPDVATYDLQPEMSAGEVTDALVEAISSRNYDAIICNYANADMVGHTGDFAATSRCIEALDKCLDRAVTAARANGMEVLITADHGNAEKMRVNGDNPDQGQPHTAHTSNPVPLIYIGRAADIAPDGCLSDIAPTMLSLMGLAIPPEMTGQSLITFKDDDDQCAA